jgi:hypothetical protein
MRPKPGVSGSFSFRRKPGKVPTLSRNPLL